MHAIAKCDTHEDDVAYLDGSSSSSVCIFFPFLTRLFLSRILSSSTDCVEGGGIGGWKVSIPAAFPQTWGSIRWATVSKLICLSVEAVAAAAAATEYSICIFILLFFCEKFNFYANAIYKNPQRRWRGERKLRSARPYQLLAMRESEMIVQLKQQ